MSFNLADALLALAQRHLNRPALIGGVRHVTFGELGASAAQVAHLLRAEGITTDQHVGIALRDGVETVIHLLALWMIDAVGVVIDFRSPAAERALLAEEFDLAAIIAETAPPAAPYKAIVATDPAWLAQRLRQPTTPPESRRDGSGIAVISLTSGTTGRPLGLLIRHEGLLLRLSQTIDRHVGRPGTYLTTMPMHFSSGRNTLLTKLLLGWTVVVYPPLFSAPELAREIIRLAPDAVGIVPTTLRGLIEHARGKAAPLFPSLSELNCGGSMISPQEKRDARALLSPNFSEAYGSSLCGGVTYMKGDDIDTHADTVGRVMPMVRLEIVDENDAPLPPGQPGIIRVRSPAMIVGTYRNRTRPYGDRIKDGWIYPGDIGSLDEEGFLRILGRASDVIIRGGANVHPSEIESVVAAHPAVREVAVVGYAAAREGEEIAAFVVPSGALSEADLTALARTRLAPDKRPRRFVLVDALPQTAVGKLDRKALRERLEAEGS